MKEELKKALGELRNVIMRELREDLRRIKVKVERRTKEGFRKNKEGFS